MRSRNKCKEGIAKLKVLVKLFKKHWVTVTLWIVAAACLYVIFCAGVHLLPCVGSCDNAENVNNVLLNLSYSYLAGGIFYLFTSTLPRWQKAKRYRPIIDEKEKIIYEKFVGCMRCVFPMDALKYQKLNISSVTSQFAQTDLNRLCYDQDMYEGMTIFDMLIEQRKGILGIIEELKEYRDYMPTDELELINKIRDSHYLGLVGVFSSRDLNEPNNRKTLAFFLCEVTNEAVKLRKSNNTNTKERKRE